MAPSVALDLDLHLRSRRHAARAELAEAMRSLSASAVPALSSEVYPTLPASAFTEPRLFSQLAQPGFDVMTLDQLTFAGRPIAAGPCQVVADLSGRVALPGFGALETDSSGIELALQYDTERAVFTTHGDVAASFPVTPSRFVAGSRIEIVEHLDPILRRFLEQHVNGGVGEITVADSPRYDTAIAQALEIIAAVRPAFHEALVESLRSVLLFTHPDAESFAALGMHGMVFLNVPQVSRIAFFVEHLTHQGGHVLFSEATLSRADFLRVDPDSCLSDIVGADDDRDLYGAFHGLYTEHMEMAVYLPILKNELVSDAEAEDFRTQLRDVSARHARDLAMLAPHAHEIFTDVGAELFRYFETALACSVEDNADLVGIGVGG